MNPPNTAEVWVAGEVLVDLIPGLGAETIAKVGGGAANTARVCAELGVTTQFIGGISSDDYGSLAKAELRASGVRLDHSPIFELPTATASVKVVEGKAEYKFQLEQTATFAFDRSWLPSGSPRVLHLGTLATLIEPGAHQLFEWASDVKAIRVFDPNIRTSICSDLSRYRSSVAEWVKLSDVVKLSNDDLAALYLADGSVKSERAVIDEYLSTGVRLVILTRGSSGISAYTAAKAVEVPAFQVEVADTVGAGDTVGAVVVEALFYFGLDDLTENRLEKMLTRAACAGALTASQIGAQPPKLSELGLLDLS